MKNKKPMTAEEFGALPDYALIRIQRLMQTGLIPFSLSTMYRRIKDGKFPKPEPVSNGLVAWRVGDVRDWLENPTGAGNEP